ncbi:MAG: tRNA (N6-isopentenyl adenosine(37)-C2)-methylthiotransferase MiaB [Treponema sp.]|nr:tRNA (N6-isopentenyl adenosine(37)-C2)-methylthiotransferase MiaB [Treponema sp.]
MNYFFETYGCQMNIAESAALKQILKGRGWVAAESGEEADLVLLNTCSVRLTAETRALGRLDHYAALKKKRSAQGHSFVIVLAGCMAERLGARIREKRGEIDYVMGTAARSLFPQILEEAEQGLAAGEFTAKKAFLASEGFQFSFSPSHIEEETGEGGPVRSFIPIMHGCNNFCSYCIVPYVRGPEISRSPASILAETRLAGGKGIREITLLGQNVNSYNWVGGGLNEEGIDAGGFDFPGLLELVAGEAEQTAVGWVRFLSSHPRDFSPRAVQVMADHPVFCRHLHLCVQHGADAVLKAMNRRYTREEYLELVSAIRRAMPGITLSTDILVGFPGETEADLEATLSLMDEVKFLYAYMYHYNPREGTSAYTLPGRIPEQVKRRRLARVIEKQKQHTGELLRARIGSREKVLIEGISRKNADELITRTEKDETAVVRGKHSLIGRFAEITLASLHGNTFRAEGLRIVD